MDGSLKIVMQMTSYILLKWHHVKCKLASTKQQKNRNKKTLPIHAYVYYAHVCQCHKQLRRANVNSSSENITGHVKRQTSDQWKNNILRLFCLCLHLCSHATYCLSLLPAGFNLSPPWTPVSIYSPRLALIHVQLGSVWWPRLFVLQSHDTETERSWVCLSGLI